MTSKNVTSISYRVVSLPPNPSEKAHGAQRPETLPVLHPRGRVTPASPSPADAQARAGQGQHNSLNFLGVSIEGEQRVYG